MGSAEEIRQDEQAQRAQRAQDVQDARDAETREAPPHEAQSHGVEPHEGSAELTAAELAAAELAEAQRLSDQRRLRRARTPWTSMLLSLAVVVGVALVLLLIVPRANEITQPPVDVTLGARAAAEQVHFTPSIPTGLPDGWRPTSVRTTRSTADVITWHVGYQTPDQQYAAVEQGQNAPAEWVHQQTNRAPQDGTEQVAGETWHRYTGGRVNQNSLVHERGDVTTIVTGTAPYEDLVVLAESLQPPG